MIKGTLETCDIQTEMGSTVDPHIPRLLELSNDVEKNPGPPKIVRNGLLNNTGGGKSNGNGTGAKAITHSNNGAKAITHRSGQ